METHEQAHELMKLLGVPLIIDHFALRLKINTMPDREDARSSLLDGRNVRSGQPGFRARASGVGWKNAARDGCV